MYIVAETRNFVLASFRSLMFNPSQFRFILRTRNGSRRALFKRHHCVKTIRMTNRRQATRSSSARVHAQPCSTALPHRKVVPRCLSRNLGSPSMQTVGTNRPRSAYPFLPWGYIILPFFMLCTEVVTLLCNKGSWLYQVQKKELVFFLLLRHFPRCPVTCRSRT